MKKHAIIPIFIPHAGCPNDCVFCNQKIITARNSIPTEEQIISTIESYLPTMTGRGLSSIEIAFFGGSFTAIDPDIQRYCLNVAKKYKDLGKIQKIRLSTRPDYINEEILNFLKEYQVDIIELGVQSMDDQVLTLSNRGHTVDHTYRAAALIKEMGFTLGIQLMIGLPGDTKEKSVKSAKIAASLKPSLARLYPTLVLEDTDLATMLRQGRFTPMDHETMISTVAEMYEILMENNITILRVGLKSTDLITNNADLGGGYHPAFRQIVEGRIALTKLESQITKTLKTQPNVTSIVCSSNSKWFSAMIGHKGCNKAQLHTTFPSLRIKYQVNQTLGPGVIALQVTDVVQ